jgi:hypothetical protein
VNTKTETKMRMKWMLTTLMVIAMATLTGAAAHGQDSGAKAKAARPGVETDAGLSGYATFNKASSGNGTQQTPTNSFGGLIELRQIRSNWFGYEMAVNDNLAAQKYVPNPGACLLACANPPTSMSADAVEFTIDYIVSHQMGKLRPFAVGGAGFFITIPASRSVCGGRRTGLQHQRSSGHPASIPRDVLQGAQHFLHLPGNGRADHDRRADGRRVLPLLTGFRI